MDYTLLHLNRFNGLGGYAQDDPLYQVFVSFGNTCRTLSKRLNVLKKIQGGFRVFGEGFAQGFWSQIRNTEL